MKYYSSVFIFVLMTTFMIGACTPKHQYPSPLKGVNIENQTLEYDETQKSISVNSYMVSVVGKCIDVESGEVSRWVRVKTAQQRVDLELIENTTIYDRKARVELTVDTDRDDIDKSVSKVEFYVTQKKSQQFNGIVIDDLVFDYKGKDTTLVLSRSLNNTKTEVRGLSGEAVAWCSVHLSGDLLKIKVDAHHNIGDRQALVKLLPTVNGSPADSITANVSFMVTQNQAPSN